MCHYDNKNFNDCDDNYCSDEHIYIACYNIHNEHDKRYDDVKYDKNELIEELGQGRRHHTLYNDPT